MRLLAELRERLRAFLSRAREDRELEEELALHVEMQIEENLRRGMRPEEARRQALLKLGGLAQVREATRDARGVRWLEEFVRDIRLAVRRLVREPGYTLPVVATLALGIGVTVAVFALVDAVVVRPLPYVDADRLVSLRHRLLASESPMTGVSLGTFQHYRDGSRAFEAAGYYLERVDMLTDFDSPEQARRALVSPGVFEALRASPMLGRLPTEEDVLPGYTAGGMLISHDLWVRRYGADPEIIGRVIEVERAPRQVIGVMPPAFHFPHPETHIWMGWPLGEASRSGVESLILSAVARLRPGVSPQDAERDLRRLVATLPDAYPDVTREELEAAGLSPLVIPFKDEVVGDVRPALLLLLGTAAFLLLITGANATNLTLARASRQRREVVVARALGAGGVHVARRFLVESALIAGLGAAVGLALAYSGVAVRFGFAPDAIPRLDDVAVNGRVLSLTLGLTLLAAMLLGVVSTLGARRADLAGALAGAAGRTTAGRREQAARRILVAGQVALAATLLIGSGLMARSFWRLSRVDLGFEPGRALTFFPPVPANYYGNYRESARVSSEILARLRPLPGVEVVEAASTPNFPLTPVPDFSYERIAAADRAAPAGGSGGAWPHALWGFATPGYFRAMGIPLMRGRTFDGGDMGPGGPAVVLSASLARDLFGAEDPIGRRVRWVNIPGFPDYTVVGVVGDVPGESLRDGASRMVYFPNVYPPTADTIVNVLLHYIPVQEVYILRATVPPASLVPAIRRAVADVDPKLMLTRMGTLDELVAGSMAEARLTMLLLLVGAGTALLLGMIGIYGVLAYTVGRRTAELGIRIALGATPAGVVRMIVGQGARVAFAGIAAGVLAALALTRFLRGLLFEVAPNDPATFAAMTALLFAVALAASYVPARRAGRIDPVRALRAE